MSVIYNVAVKAASMNAKMDYFANGTLELLSAADVLLASFGLDAAGGSVTDDVWTFVFDADTVAGAVGAGGGTDATKAQVKTSLGDAHITGLTVGITGAGTDIELDNNNIASGQDVTLTGFSITHA